MRALDPNIASELMRPEPTPTVAAWISDRDAEELYLTAVSEAELLYSVAIMPTGRRRNALDAALSRWLDLGFADRILPCDSSAAQADGDRIPPTPCGSAHRRSRLLDRHHSPLARCCTCDTQRTRFRGYRGRCSSNTRSHHALFQRRPDPPRRQGAHRGADGRSE